MKVKSENFKRYFEILTLFHTRPEVKKERGAHASG